MIYDNHVVGSVRNQLKENDSRYRGFHIINRLDYLRVDKFVSVIAKLMHVVFPTGGSPHLHHGFCQNSWPIYIFIFNCPHAFARVSIYSITSYGIKKSSIFMLASTLGSLRCCHVSVRVEGQRRSRFIIESFNLWSRFSSWPFKNTSSRQKVRCGHL